MPVSAAVPQRLLKLGFGRDAISAAMDTGGVTHCLDALAGQGVHVRHDGVVVAGAAPATRIAAETLLWGQARKVHHALLDALESSSHDALRARVGDSKRDLARLSSCAGPVSSRWLTQFPASWWPQFGDDRFDMALKFRLGLPLHPAGLKCAHKLSKDQAKQCGKDPSEIAGLLQQARVATDTASAPA